LKKSYLFVSISPRGRFNDGEDNEEDVTIRISERSKSIVLFLSCSIPQSEVDHAAIDLDSGGIVVKDGRDVLGRELVLSIA
jgi:hypothetical protein